MAWHYKDGDEEIGPVEKNELQELINSKRIGADTLVRNSAAEEWKPLADIVSEEEKAESDQPEPAEKTSQTETAVCSQCGNSFPKNQVVTFDGQVVCAACKPVFVQRIKEGVAPQGDFRFAGFWIRFGAKIIDSLILMAVNFIFVLLLGGISGGSAMTIDPATGTLPEGYWLFFGIQQLVSIALPILYNTYLVGRFGATVGKMACGLKIVTPYSERVSYPRALGRTFAEWISSIILSIGYIMAAFDSEKRSLHDRICSTRVIYK
jgi:uncharacterized RDD family membrane protein YckC